MDEASSLIVQLDGKIIVAGTSGDAGSFGSTENGDFVLVRYRSNGAVDTTFGSNGVVMTDFNASNDYAESVAIGPNGKIVVAGWNTDYVTGARSFALARYNANAWSGYKLWQCRESYYGFWPDKFWRFLFQHEPFSVNSE